jgi:hypothetical protein
VDTEDRNPQHFVWEINSVAVRRKEIKALGAETIYVPGAGSEFAGATCVGASSAASGNAFVHITCAGLTALTQTDEKRSLCRHADHDLATLAVVERARPRDWSNSRSAQNRKTKTCKSVNADMLKRPKQIRKVN